MRTLVVAVLAVVALAGCDRAPGDPFQATHSTVLPISGEATVGQSFVTSAKRLVGVDLLVATYAGTAGDGELAVEVLDGPGGAVLTTGSVEGESLPDPGWVPVRFDQPVDGPGEVAVEVSWTGDGSIGLYASVPPADPDEPRLVNDPITDGTVLIGGQPAPGDLAIRAVAASGTHPLASARAVVGGALRGLAAEPVWAAAWGLALAGCVALAGVGFRRRD